MSTTPTNYTIVKKNQQYLDKYETLVGNKYKEPVDGKFEDATDSILQRLKESEDSGRYLLTRTLTLT